MGALAGGRRGAGALERLYDRTNPATVAVYSNTPDFPWEQVRHLPNVAAMHLFLLDYTYAFDGFPQSVLGFPPVDDAILHDIETPVVFEGRMYDPSRVDEVVVTRRLLSAHQKKLGDQVVISLPSKKEMAQQEGSGPGGSFTGPRIKTKIVGVVGSPFFGDEPGSTGQIFVSPAVVAQYRDYTIGKADNPNNLFNFVSALVRLRHGEADLAVFESAVSRIQPGLDLEFTHLREQQRGAQREISFEARCLLAFGVVALVAAVFLVGQAVARYTTASTTELRSLQAVGITPRQSVVATAAGPIIAGAVGALVGVAGAYFASSYFPLGTADLIEPSPGRSADWTVFGPGIALVILLIAFGAMAAAWLGLAAARRESATGKSALAATVARAGLPVPVLIGTRFALEAGRGRTAVPVRPALLGAVSGVIGVLAAFTFARGVSDAIDNPERFGQTDQLESYLGTNSQDFVPAAKIVAAIAAHPDVTGVNDTRQSIATGADRNGTVVLYSHSAGNKELPTLVTDGRMPQAPDEVALAPQSMKLLHTAVGKTVRLTGGKGAGPYRVTGAVLIPEGPRNSYSEGGWLTTAGYDALFSGFKFHLLQVSLRDGVDIAATNAALTKAIEAAAPEAAGYSLEAAELPVEMTEIQSVRTLPVILGGFLALLAVGAVGHALATAVRRRSRDVAVLRALGMTRWQCRWVIFTQATVLALVGLLVGIPLGLAVGRTVWRVVTDALPVQYVPPFAAVAMLSAVPVALVLANLLAAVPGRRAARLRIAQILRTE
jgi:ABC-type antimicrobial peptide transport system permease subunit